MLKDRISSARGVLERYDVDFLIFVNLCNIRYLTGFTGSAGLLVLGREEGWFFTDSRYTTQAAAEVNGCSVIECRSNREGVTSLLQGMPFGKAGFEAGHMTVALYNELSAALRGVELKPIGTELDSLRAVKDADEIQLLAKSAEIASSAFLHILDMIKPGAVERDVALALEAAMKSSGADEKAFDFIVASGSRGALPHGKASTKVIASGELVTVDFGTVCQGYFSDETVTVAVGEPDNRQQKIYSIVKNAHDLALAAVRPGITFKELDAVARDFIAANGFGNYFGHGLGHGVGLEIHEYPAVSSRSDDLVVEGMVFTIEPGIYIPDWGGVRIEDTVVVTANGCTILTKVPKELQIVC
jgi:Xaa-Pro aminopeptidase